MADALLVADQDSHLYICTLDGTLVTDIGDVMEGANQLSVTGMAWDPTTDTLFAVTRTVDAFRPSSLITIDPEDGTATFIGALGLTGAKTCTDISINSSGQLYGWRAGTNGCLVSINKATGAGTQIGSSTSFGGAFQFVEDVAYFIPQTLGENIATVNLGTGAKTDTVALGGDIFAVNCATVLDGTPLVGIYNEIATLDLVTGETVVSGFPPVGGGSMDAMATIPGPLEVEIDADPASGTTVIPVEVTFSPDTTETFTSWAWDFGDGDTSTDESPTHTYPLAGTYTVTLVATGPDGEGTAELAYTALGTGGGTLLPPCGSALDPQTFFGAPWRTVVTTLDGQILTFLDRLASDRQVEFALNTPATAAGKVPSGDPEVNIPHDDGSPFLSYSDRLLYMFRREGVNPNPEGPPMCWVPRFAGILMPLQDQAGSDNATSSYTAFDPWQLLKSRPLTKNLQFIKPTSPLVFKNTSADVVVKALLDEMADFMTTADDPKGPPGALQASYDAMIDWGQTDFYEGTIETAGTVVYWKFDTDTVTVGDAMQDLANAGHCDIVLRPIYDPFNRPGYLAELSIYAKAGTARNGAVMAWDRPSRSLVGVDALYDGGQMANIMKWMVDQGPAVPPKRSDSSIARYGQYWDIVHMPGRNAHHSVDLLADAELVLRQNGKRTLSVQPAAGRSPIPFLEYELGDEVPVWASNAMRQPLGPEFSSGEWLQPWRVYGISIALDDDDTERVDSLLLSTDQDELI